VTFLTGKFKPYNKWAQKSFSQCGEDLIVKFIFDNLQISHPTYIDIGAHHPFYLSNTALFYELGSRGINIEPDPVLFKEFLAHRKNDVNLNIGISNENGYADFYLISSPTLNTFSKEEAENYKTQGDYSITNVIKIPISTFKKIIDEQNNEKYPDFLNIDAEGVDELIVTSLDYTQNYPIVICLETMSFSTSGSGVKNLEMINFITNKGYIEYASTYINTIFVKENIWKKS